MFGFTGSRHASPSLPELRQVNWELLRAVRLRLLHALLRGTRHRQVSGVVARSLVERTNEAERKTGRRRHTSHENYGDT